MTNLEVKNIAPEINRRIKNIVINSVAQIAEQVVQNTPVKTGKAKAGWHLQNANGNKVSIDSNNIKTSLQNAMNDANNNMADISLVNNVPYINFLEDKNKMLATSLQNFKPIVSQQTNKNNS